MTDSVTKTIVGVCEEISEKNGWTTFHVNAGSKYPVRLSTKLPALIEQGREAGSETAAWTYKEVESDTINENTGKPYVNRYVEKVEVGDHAASAPNTGVTSAPERPQAGAHDPVAIGDKERLIVRQTCLKVAGQLFSGLGNVEKVDERDNVVELIAAAARFETWLYRDIDDPPFG